MNDYISEVKTVNDTMNERLDKLDKLIGFERSKVDIKEIALRKSVNCFKKALQNEEESVSVCADDMMRQFAGMDLERLLCTGARVPILEEQVGCRKYVMFINFYEAENGMNLNMDLKKYDFKAMTVYHYNEENDEWIEEPLVEDILKNVEEKKATESDTIDLLVEAKENGDMSEQALYCFLYSEHESEFGSDIRAFANAAKPLVLLANELAGIAKVEILKDQQIAVVPADIHHKGIAVTSENGWYCINNYYADDMVLEDGTVAEKDKYFYIRTVYKTKTMETAAKEFMNAVNARRGMMYPVTLVIKKGLVVTIRESSPEKMIYHLRESIKEIRGGGKITDTDVRAVTEFVGGMQKMAEMR